MCVHVFLACAVCVLARDVLVCVRSRARSCSLRCRAGVIAAQTEVPLGRVAKLAAGGTWAWRVDDRGSVVRVRARALSRGPFARGPFAWLADARRGLAQVASLRRFDVKLASGRASGAGAFGVSLRNARAQSSSSRTALDLSYTVALSMPAFAEGGAPLGANVTVKMPLELGGAASHPARTTHAFAHTRADAADRSGAPVPLLAAKSGGLAIDVAFTGGKTSRADASGDAGDAGDADADAADDGAARRAASAAAAFSGKLTLTSAGRLGVALTVPLSAESACGTRAALTLSGAADLRASTMRAAIALVLQT